MNPLTLALNSIGTACALIAAVAGWSFVWRYRKTDYRRWTAGRHLMEMTAGIATIMTYVILFQMVAKVVEPPNPWLTGSVQVARLLIFVWVAYMMVKRAQLLDLSSHDPRRLLRPTDDDSDKRRRPGGSDPRVTLEPGTATPAPSR